MKINKLYEYPKSMRSVINGGRHYDIDGDKLPSVTTILSATQSPEKKASLDAWKAKMGDKIADQIRDRAAARGTAMHTYLEHYLDGTGYKDLTPMGRQAETMANKIIETGLGDLEELWGLETTLYYPDLYAAQRTLLESTRVNRLLLTLSNLTNLSVGSGFKITLNSWEHIPWRITKFMVRRYSLESF